MANFMTWTGSGPPVFSALPQQNSGPVVNKFADRWITDAAIYGSRAHVDPRLVVAVMMTEGVDFKDSERYAEGKAIEDAARGNEVANWSRRTFDNPEGMSLGITNMKEGTFDDVKAAFPTEFKDDNWSDLATNHDLAVKALTYNLARYDRLYATGGTKVSSDMMDLYSRNEFLAAAYNVGPGTIAANVGKGYLGPAGADYSNRTRNHFADASRLVSQLYRELPDAVGGMSDPGMPAVSAEHPALPFWDYAHDRMGTYAAGGDVDSDQATAQPGESLYNGMFALDHVTGSPFWNNMSGAIGKTAYHNLERAAAAADPVAGAVWDAFQQVVSPLENPGAAMAESLGEDKTPQTIGSTAARLLRIHGHSPNLDPHVYGGDDGPLSTARTGTLFRSLDPLKSYVGNQVFTAAAPQIAAWSGYGSGNDNTTTIQPQGDSDTSSPDLGQLARTALQNAGRVITSFATPAVIAPSRALGPDTQVRRAFSIVMDLPPDDPLFTRDRRTDAVLAFGRH